MGGILQYLCIATESLQNAIAIAKLYNYYAGSDVYGA